MLQPTLMHVDAHQHFWRYSEEEYPWMQPAWPIRRDFLPGNLQPELHACGITGSVAVQARQTLEETAWLLGLAEGAPLIEGVVGWVDLQSATVDEQLTAFSQRPKLIGVRHVVQDEEDPQFLARPGFRQGIAHLSRHSLTFDLLIRADQLRSATALVTAFPEQRFVLDHIAKPKISKQVLQPWAEHLQRLADLPNIFCKLSGLLTEADWKKWKPSDFQPYLDVVFAAFGPERLMFGSDWPVALLAGSYSDAYTLVSDYVDRRAPASRDQIFGLTASQFYQFPI